MVSRLVAKDEGNRTSEEGIMSSSKGPDISKRVQMATVILRPTTAQMVLGQEALFLPTIILSCDRSRTWLRFREEFLQTLMDQH